MFATLMALECILVKLCELADLCFVSGFNLIPDRIAILFLNDVQERR